MFDRLKAKIRGTFDIKQLKKDGFILGENVTIMGECVIDPGHCWLIEIGNNVTLAPRVHILAHDASTKMFLGYTRIASVKICNNVFIGAGSVILPGVIIEDNVIVGAGSVVTHNLEKNGVYVGNPATKIADLDVWLSKRKEELSVVPVYNVDYIYDNISDEMKAEMKEALKRSEKGYIV